MSYRTSDNKNAVKARTNLVAAESTAIASTPSDPSYPSTRSSPALWSKHSTARRTFYGETNNPVFRSYCPSLQTKKHDRVNFAPPNTVFIFGNLPSSSISKVIAHRPESYNGQTTAFVKT